MLPENLNNVVISGEGTANSVLLAQPQGDTTAGTAIADCVIALTAFDDGMDKTSLVALSQDILGFLLGYLAIIIRSFFYEYITTESEHYLRVYRVVTMSKHGTTGAWTQRQSF